MQRAANYLTTWVDEQINKSYPKAVPLAWTFAGNCAPRWRNAAESTLGDEWQKYAPQHTVEIKVNGGVRKRILTKTGASSSAACSSQLLPSPAGDGVPDDNGAAANYEHPPLPEDEEW